MAVEERKYGTYRLDGQVDSGKQMVVGIWPVGMGCAEEKHLCLYLAAGTPPDVDPFLEEEKTTIHLLARSRQRRHRGLLVNEDIDVRALMIEQADLHLQDVIVPVGYYEEGVFHLVLSFEDSLEMKAEVQDSIFLRSCLLHPTKNTESPDRSRLAAQLAIRPKNPEGIYF